MKRFLSILLCSFPLLLGCDKESGKEIADYYVRYEYSLTSSSPMGGVQYSNKTITINTDSGVIDVTTYVNAYTETIGPVKKGFNASISVQYNGSSGGTTNLKIYVARGSEPFALKASTNSTTASYTIDY